MVEVVPVIMCGGAGTRLWPLSTPDRPKPFHALNGERSLFRQTVTRLAEPGRAPPAPVVVCNAGHRAVVETQLEEEGVVPAAILLEPVGRGTAAVAAVGALTAQALSPGALCLLAPADHVIADAETFRAAVSRAAPVARDRIVTFGIRPESAHTGYGYILRGDALVPGVFAVEAFREKPDAATARAYVEAGTYDWNAGLFLFAPEVMLAELERHAPEVLAAAHAALGAGPASGRTSALEASAFAACPNISIDHAVMERTDRAAVAPCSVGWADLGDWSEVWRLATRDADGNAARGRAAFVGARDNLAVSDGPPVAIVGLDGIAVVATRDGIVVTRLEDAQKVKQAAEAFPFPTA